MATTTSYPSTKERTNYARLCRVIVDIGTDALRDILRRKVPAESLPVKVKDIHLHFNSKEQDVITSVSNKGYANFDISLLYKLLRTLSVGHGIDFQKPTRGWGTIQNVHDTSLGDDIERIRLIRNSMYGHVTDTCISDNEFITHWDTLKNVMKRMDLRFTTGGTYLRRYVEIETYQTDFEEEKLIKSIAELQCSDKDESKTATLYDRSQFDATDSLTIDGLEHAHSSEMYDDSAAASMVVPQTKYKHTPTGNPEFVHLNPKYECLICFSVLRDAVQSSCGHRFCQLCADSYFTDAKFICPANEEDCVEVSKDEIYPDAATRKDIRNLLVYCTFRKAGCDKEIRWRELSKHEEGCEYKLIECTYKDMGCMEKVAMKFFETHVNNCRFRSVKCTYCKKDIAKALKAEHEKLDCPRFPVSCEYTCGIKKLPREEMKEHMETCTKKPRSCAYAPVGCGFKGSDEDVKKHENTAESEHIELTSKISAKLKQELKDINSTMKEVEQIHLSQKRDSENEIQYARNVKSEFEISRAGMSNASSKVDGLIVRINDIEEKLELFAPSSVVNYNNREIQDMKGSIKRVKDKLEQIERAGLFNFGSSSQAGSTFAQKHETIIEKMKNHDRQIILHDVQITELDLRFQMLETANYDGVLMWKIRDYRRRKQEAISGKTLSLYSQPCYTSRFGYKFCGRVYLNGDGSGKGTHLSFYFLLMKGDFDALQKWPFQLQVTLQLLNVADRRQDVIEGFFPDPSNDSFRRPTSDMNVSTGCPRFISHQQLESGSYCKEDTLYLKVIVSLKGFICPGRK